MPSQLILDRTDPGIDEMVGEWKNGGEYELSVKVRQVGTDPKTATFEVIETTDETSDESSDMPEDGETPETPEDGPMGGKMGKMGGSGKMGKVGKMTGKPAIMIAFGHH
jgi:hypothetical protein